MKTTPKIFFLVIGLFVLTRVTLEQWLLNKRLQEFSVSSYYDSTEIWKNAAAVRIKIYRLINRHLSFVSRSEMNDALP